MPRCRRHYCQHRWFILDRYFLLLFTITTLLSHQARAEQGHELVLTDGTRLSATLIEFEYNLQTTAWRFTNATNEPLERAGDAQLVRWGNPTKAKQAATLVLRDGSTLITDRTWAASGYVRVNEETVGLNRRDGWATIDRTEAKWLLLEAAREGTPKEELLHKIAGDPSEYDLLWLVGGDQIAGKVQSVGDSEISILLGKDATPTKVPVSRIRAIRFAADQKEKRQEPVCMVGLEDGTLLVAGSVKIQNKKAQLRTLSGLYLEVEAKTIVFLQPIRDHQNASSGQESLKNPTVLRRAIKYLSEQEADGYRSTPYFDLAWPFARDVSLEGTPLKAGGRQYAKGLAMHSAARLVYQLENDNSLRFQAELAIADTTPSIGSVVFRVYTIREGEIKPVYKSPVVRGGDAPLPMDVDLTGATALVLVVDYADNGDMGDQALWLDARLLTGKSKKGNR